MPRKKNQSTYNRRGNREGSIYQRKDGKWVGQVQIGFKPNGKPERKYFYGSTRDEVSKKVAETTAKAFIGQVPIKCSDTTLDDFLTNWLNTFKRVEVAPRTFEWYCNVSKGIIDGLGGVSLKKLSSLQIQDFFNRKLHNEGKSVRTVKSYRDVLNQAMRYAVDARFIECNPVDHTKIPKQERKVDKGDDTKAMSIETRQVVLNAAAKDPTYKPIIYTLMFTGMRAGELLALPWKNVDLENGIITIDRAVTLDASIDENLNQVSRKTVVSSTKTYSSDRKIKIPSMLVDILREWEQKQSNHPKNTHLTDPDSIVFSNQYGDMRTYNGFRTSYRRFLNKYDLTAYNINLHSFRHTFATMLLESGVNPRIVQKLLGHKDISTTLNTYSHVLDEVYEGVADTLDQVCCDTINGTFSPVVGGRKIAQLAEVFTEAI